MSIPPGGHDNTDDQTDHNPRGDRKARFGGRTASGLARIRESERGLVHWAELDPRIADIAQALLRVLLKASREEQSNSLRCFGRKRLPVRIVTDDGSDDISRRLSLKRPAPAEHFVQHTPKRPDVGALVHRVPARLFRAHIRRRTENA